VCPRCGTRVEEPVKTWTLVSPLPDKKGRIKPIDYRLPKEVEMPSEEYPLMMTTGRMLYHFHTGTMTRRVKGINEIVGKAYVEISPQDAESLGIRNGDVVKVCSRRGCVVTHAVVTDKMQPGVVFMPFHFAEARANLLTGEILDPESRIPAYKVSAVRIEKVEGVEVEPPDYVKKVMEKA
jgi:predicted molibdopterin-dependent oxidoreductase YjgC